MELQSEEDWVNLCVQRIAEVDPQMAADEALQLARDLHGFERTAVMPPAAAVDFVVLEMARPGSRFERRTKPRDNGAG